MSDVFTHPLCYDSTWLAAENLNNVLNLEIQYTTFTHCIATKRQTGWTYSTYTRKAYAEHIMFKHILHWSGCLTFP